MTSVGNPSSDPSIEDRIDTLLKQSSLRKPGDSIGFMLWQLSHAWQRHLDAALAPTGLTHLQFVVIGCLGWHTRLGRPLTQATLSRFAKIHPMQISQVVKTLVAKELIVRVRAPDDARAHYLELTDTGTELLLAAIPIAENTHHSFFKVLPGQDDPLKTHLSTLFEAHENDE